MIIFGYEIRRRPRIRYVTTDKPRMGEAQLNEALAVPAAHPVLRAVLQLIDTAQDNATVQAAMAIESAGKLAGYVGGHEHLALLRDEILGRRTAVADAQKPASE